MQTADDRYAGDSREEGQRSSQQVSLHDNK